MVILQTFLARKGFSKTRVATVAKDTEFVQQPSSQPPEDNTSFGVQCQETAEIPTCNDFGNVIKKVRQMSNSQKLMALENRWYPQTSDEYPCSFHVKQGKQRRRALTAGQLQR